MALTQGWILRSEQPLQATPDPRTALAAPRNVHQDFALFSEVDSVLQRLRQSPLLGQPSHSTDDAASL